MTPRVSWPHCLLTASLSLAAVGCSPAPRTASPADEPVALVNGTPLPASALLPTLMDLAGVQALREHVLGQMLTARCAAAGVTITDAMVDAELTRLKREPAPVANPDRLREIARRNAALRQLSAASVVVTDAQVAQAYVIRYGPRARVSVIVVSNERDAAEVLAAVRDSSDTVFASVAQARSIDASAPLGGQLGTVSAEDPALPLALRNAFRDAAPGETRGPVLLPRGVAILRVHEQIPAENHTEKTFTSSIREELRRELLEREHARAMELLAERLISQASITIMDDRLRRAWKSHNAPDFPR